MQLIGFLVLALLLPVAALAQAISYVPPPSAMYYSSDGTGNIGTWTPVTGGGAGALSGIPPAIGMYCSSDGSGNAGTWGPCASGGGGGGAGVTAGSVWQREGTIISAPLSEEYNASEPTLIYEGSPQLLTGIQSGQSVWKLWWNCGYLTTGLCYAESIDAENWLRRSTPVIARQVTTGVAHGYVFHYNGTYYYYGARGVIQDNGFDMYTSSDGITWTLAHPLVIVPSVSWENQIIGNIFVVPSAGTWYAMYEASNTGTGLYQMGVASSADQGVTWTKYAGNPIFPPAPGKDAGGPEIHLIGSTYYVWYTCGTTNGVNTPTEICRAHTTTFMGPWTLDNGGAPVFTRATQDEGEDVSDGQVADPSMVQVGSTIYMAYDGVYIQNGTSPDSFHLKLATAPYTFAQLVTTSEGNATNYHANGAFENLNLFPCVYWDNNFNRVPCANGTGQLELGTITMIGSATFPSRTLNAYYNGSSNKYILNGGAYQDYLDVTNSTFHASIAASGSAGGTPGFFDVYTINGSSGLTFPIGFTSTGNNQWNGTQSFNNAVTLNYASPSIKLTNTTLSENTYLGNGGGYEFLSNDVAQFFGFTGGATPKVSMQANASFGWAATNTAIAAVDSAFSRYGVNAIAVGNGTLNDASGNFKAGRYNTGGNCISIATPAACSGSAAGGVAVPAASTTLVVNTTAVSANSQIYLTFDSSLGTRLGVTCNTTIIQPTVSARTPGTSFTITMSAAPTTNPACIDYFVMN